MRFGIRAYSRFAPSQWETLLQSNGMLGANLESALWDACMYSHMWDMFSFSWSSIFLKGIKLHIWRTRHINPQHNCTKTFCDNHHIQIYIPRIRQWISWLNEMVWHHFHDESWLMAERFLPNIFAKKSQHCFMEKRYLIYTVCNFNAVLTAVSLEAFDVDSLITLCSHSHA